jgi:superfamily II DNA/RNA helicase
MPVLTEFERISEDGTIFDWEPSADQKPQIQHFVTPVPAHVREIFLVILIEDIMKSDDFTQVLVFASHCETAEVITLILRKFKYKTAMLHSKMNQDDRFQALRDFRGGRQRILVATDVAARGLDIPFVDHVIHFNLPPSATIYVHRAGRTGRAGRNGRSILFVNRGSDAEIVAAIEAELGHEMEVMQLDEKLVLSKMRDVMSAKRDAKISMFDNHFGEREKRIQQIEASKIS